MKNDCSVYSVIFLHDKFPTKKKVPSRGNFASIRPVLFKNNKPRPSLKAHLSLLLNKFIRLLSLTDCTECAGQKSEIKLPIFLIL